MSERSTVATEGRARRARPSACLLSVIAAVACFAFAAPAQAAPTAPMLTGTNPASPATALRPLVKGTVDGVIISGLPRSASVFPGGSGAGGGAGSSASENPDFIIKLYTDKDDCSGGLDLAGEGTVLELEGAGVPVDDDVAEEAVTNFYATQTDPAAPADPSSCSASLEYRQVSSPPTAPAFTLSSPASPADNNHPRLIGTADKQAAITIYASGDCSGTPVQTGSGSEFTVAGIQVPVADNSETVFSATATLAGFVSPCSSSTIVYQEVSSAGGGPGGETPGGESPGDGEPPTGGAEPPADGGDGSGGAKGPDPKGKPPAPTLRTVPGYAANDNTPTVTGKAPGAARVEIYGSADCKGPVLARGPAQDFTGPGFEIQVANDTAVTFFGVSIDAGDDRSACSDVAIFIEDSTAPHTRITSGPAARTKKRKAIFRFADIAGETSVSFSCKLDKRPWKACRAPLKLKGLKLRSHVLRVKAVDAAGNEEQGVAKRRFRVVRGH